MIDQEESINIPELLGVPKRGIIFSDLDGVWFDEGANFAAAPKRDLAVISEAKTAGYWVVLVSDTGSDGLAAFARELACSPMVIGENGAVFYLPDVGLKQYFIKARPFFSAFRSKATEALKTNSPSSRVVAGDATAMVRTNQITGIPGELVYLINTTRECSYGVYTRRADQRGRLVVDDQLTRQTKAVLNRQLGSNSQLVCKRYPQLGSCLVKDPTVNKPNAVRQVIDQLPAGLSYYMIGDSSADSMTALGGQITTCGKNNASDELKDAARTTNGLVAASSLPLAAGANYIIRQILENRR
ncbi:hypothetical protein M1523_02965 [Patescibacteria group bacterium]|nr:hypothetical protein [Patescibacteria group bacterium]